MGNSGRAMVGQHAADTPLDALVDLEWRRNARARTLGWLAAGLCALMALVCLGWAPLVQGMLMCHPTLVPLLYPHSPDLWPAVRSSQVLVTYWGPLGPGAGTAVAAFPLLVIGRLVMPALGACCVADTRRGPAPGELLLAGIPSRQVLFARAASVLAPVAAVTIAGLVGAILYGAVMLGDDEVVRVTDSDAWQRLTAHMVWAGVWYAPLSMLLSAGTVASAAVLSRRWDTALVSGYATQLLVVPGIQWAMVLVSAYLSRGGKWDPSAWIGWLPYLPLAALALEASLLALLLRLASRSLTYPKT